MSFKSPVLYEPCMAIKENVTELLVIWTHIYCSVTDIEVFEPVKYHSLYLSVIVNTISKLVSKYISKGR